MVATNTEEVPSKFVPEYDRLSELKAFDEKKEGVKGLVDAGVTQIPRIFCHPPKDINKNSVYNDAQFIIPVIDLESISKDSVRRKEIARRVGDASEKLGFFQVVNHGIPVSVLEDMKDGARRFFEQDTEVKKEFYTRDFTRKMVYNSNYDLYTSTAANWRDTFFSYMAPTRPNPEELPEACRKEMILYSKQVMELGVTLLELLSEALGLDTNHLNKMECGEGLTFVCHYYPACPQPELTLGTTKHTDNDFFTVLLQDHIGGLQVFHEDKWLDVPPVPGALVVNMGDILQLISNDKFKSVEHRVLASHEGPRVSVACFFSTSFQPSSRLYGPIKELLSEDNPPVYRETTVNEYVTYSFKHDIEGTSPLQHFKL